MRTVGGFRRSPRVTSTTPPEYWDRLGVCTVPRRGRIARRRCRAPAVTADDPLAQLSLQELQVVRLAAAGASNKQIGAQLFLSPRTVGFHLYRAFPKLGVTTREELARYAP